MQIEVLKKEEYRSLPKLYSECFLDKPWNDDWHTIDEFDPNGVFVLKEKGELLGFVVSFLRKRNPYISVLGVKEEVRKRGYARKLMDKVLESYKDYETFYLHVEKKRRSAISFYQTYGFELVKEVGDDYYMVYHKDKNFPSEIKALIKDKPYQENTVGMTDSKIYIFDQEVLKVEKICEESLNEARMLEWLQGRLPIPKLFCVVKEQGRQYILMERLIGAMAFEEPYIGSPITLVKMLAEALKMVWSVRIDDCPSDQGLKVKLKLAEDQVKKGKVDIEEFDFALLKEFGLSSPRDILDYLNTHQPNENLVFTHGDFCLPNLIFREEKLVGFIDLGRSGLSDLWQDLALVIRSLKYNLGSTYKEEYRDLLCKELGLAFDKKKFQYYLLLDELF